MDSVVPWIVGGLLLVAALLLASAFYFYDVVTKFQYHHFRDEWEADGEPQGFYWLSPGASWENSRQPRTAQSWDLFWSTPAWIRDQPQVRNSLRYYRMMVLGWFVVLFSLPLSINGIYQLLLWVFGETA